MSSAAQLRAWRHRALVHASYLVNLATPDPVAIERSIVRIGHELDAAARAFGAQRPQRPHRLAQGQWHRRGHRAGRRGARPDPRRRPADGGEPRLVLEDSAGQGGGIGVTIEELGAILDAAAARRRPVAAGHLPRHRAPVGRRLCHRRPDAIDELLDSVDRMLGPDGLAMIHLNDSRVRRGSRARPPRAHRRGVDRRTLAWVTWCGTRGWPRMPMILETPGMDSGWDAVNMARVRSLLAGGRSEPLPPAAFLARGDRT